jgi:hypothetical protein
LKFLFSPPAIGGEGRYYQLIWTTTAKVAGEKEEVSTIDVLFEKHLIFITFSRPTAGRKYTDKFTFEGCFKS